MKNKDKIKEILENFNFNRVHDVMVHLKWTWGLENEAPSIKKLKKCAKDLLKRSKKYGSISTGGFEARYYKKGKEFSLMFILYEYSTY